MSPTVWAIKIFVNNKEDNNNLIFIMKVFSNLTKIHQKTNS